MAAEKNDGHPEPSTHSSETGRLSDKFLAVEMPGEEGPDGEQHYPSYTDGCYYERTTNCCTFCYVRKTLDVF